MTPRTGRPPSDNAKSNQYRIRMSDEEVERLNYCCEVLHITKAEVIRKGIDHVYNELIKEKES